MNETNTNATVNENTIAETSTNENTSPNTNENVVSTIGANENASSSTNVNGFFANIKAVWKGFQPKTRKIIVIVVLAILAIGIISSSGPKKYVVKPNSGKQNCSLGTFAVSGGDIDSSYWLLFAVKKPTDLIGIKSECSTRIKETYSGAGGPGYGWYDIMDRCPDVNGDGYVDFEISRFDGEDFVTECIIRIKK